MGHGMTQRDTQYETHKMGHTVWGTHTKEGTHTVLLSSLAPGITQHEEYRLIEGSQPLLCPVCGGSIGCGPQISPNLLGDVAFRWGAGSGAAGGCSLVVG